MLTSFKTTVFFKFYSFDNDIQLAYLLTKIGDIELNNLALTKNLGNAEKTGVIYIIKLGEIGLINNTDPVSEKEIELWIKPITNEKTLQIEIRQMGMLDAFPMGEVVLEKLMSL